MSNMKYITIKLICAGCNREIIHQLSHQEQWGMCALCGAFLCKACREDYALYSENICPGSRVTEMHHFELTEIPTSLIKDYALTSPLDLRENMVYQLFFKELAKQADPFGEIQTKYLQTFNLTSQENSRLASLWNQHNNIKRKIGQGKLLFIKQHQTK